MSIFKKKVLIALITISGGLFSITAHAGKCKGVSMMWVNDCTSSAYGGHDCAYQAQGDFNPEEWLKMKDKDCSAVQEAVTNPVVANYLLDIRKDVVTSGKVAKKPKALKCGEKVEATDCKKAKAFTAAKAFKKYVKRIQKGTLVAKKRGKDFSSVQ